ncbi:SGNH/GDSL hydrolase family protein [Kitasatospora sp. YST-16]|uniref:SGNH/GDSL hydrolase family protein n=1 Tax=Kitasatospora sp. YST-16 TaxID=2998080 RepID=UPI002284742F|nr:SGNH/GDSL hydrolase family protein [Kitasatospora sp. YST-16]WAL74661.1 SGNH/GDSL hydrolase family protein [Kitasatospora sp. YST-16]WNW40719.1 SGNH/GDSL hydrolase family protein [Streptomyces sp. Li-HN-5-13]
MHRRISRLLAAALPVLATVGMLASPAGAATPTYDSTTHYVAMGDSYSAGLGAANPTLPCGQSTQGYPTLWAQDHGIASFTDVTCSGAVSDDVLTKQLPALNAQTDVVTITIGGNDVGLGQQVSTCLSGGDQVCSQTVQQFKADLPTYLAKIDQTYAAIRQAAPNAKVYVLGYPHLFEPSPICWDLAPSLAARITLNDGNDALNNGLAQHATQAGFTFVDVRQAFSGRSDCSFLPSWINPTLNLLAPLHPTADGYKYGYFATLKSVTG